MPTFTRIETVDARQFTGGKENGCGLVLWATEHGAYAFWLDHDEHAPERIKLVTDEFSRMVWITDWIVLRQDGRLDLVRMPEFELQGYVQV